MDPTLQSCERNGDGRPTNLILEIQERSKADELRARVTTHMCENIDNFSTLEGDAINADLPRRLRYTSVNDRILAMADPVAMPGELELVSTAKVLNRSIYVLKRENVAISRYAVDECLGEDPLFVLFESVGEDVSHYDCLIHAENTEENQAKAPSSPERSENQRDIASLIESISPVPKLLPCKKRTRKAESAAILTSSPYKQSLQEKKKEN